MQESNTGQTADLLLNGLCRVSHSISYLNLVLVSVAPGQTLGISEASALAAWRGAEASLKQDRTRFAIRSPGKLFLLYSGTTTSGLNAAIASSGAGTIRTAAPVLTADRAIEVHRRDLTLELAETQIMGSSALPYLLRIENAANVTINGGSFSGTASGILVSASDNVSITRVHLESLHGAGIVVTGSTKVTVSDNTLSRLAMAGILIHKGTTQSVIRGNRISEEQGYSNMEAGIVVSDREVDVSLNPAAVLGPDGYWAITEPITARLNPPHDNLIAWNSVTTGLSSGIYSDGGIRNVFAGNFLQGNSKEGLCLDNGSSGNVVASNTVQDNGARWGHQDAVLEYDSIRDGGRLPDGTAAEKVPGISLDNAVYNLVLSNNVSHNFGGGVKIVRTGYFNVIGLNLLVHDNDGASDRFHFFGIELGAAPGSSAELDFTASRGNIVFSNVIRGSHYSGIFLAAGSDRNYLAFNAISDAGSWALEAAQAMTNSSVNNLTNLPSRNIGSGLDPMLITAGAAVMDMPPAN
ncbi:MAG TPA: right-handed parallel beta-helix repeat-containing protein [Bryobacteraceae bacterium]|nr:right-handed parallel beta-helix repeat-containing protein [Bryobacteraceae bacterium]